ncbi:hypothetical protein LTR66_010048, partial [Elasticomyces elasticus]
MDPSRPLEIQEDQGPKKRRRVSKASEDQAEASTTTPPIRRRRAMLSPHHDSGKAATMQRSASPLDQTGAVRYTKTGRVSKAAKGLRVHQCDDCGKVRDIPEPSRYLVGIVVTLLQHGPRVMKDAQSVKKLFPSSNKLHHTGLQHSYTRAEHLRRHRLNHAPGAYPCDIPGCTRSFHRIDLLNRHKERHNDPNTTTGRRNSTGSESSAVESESGLGAPVASSSAIPNVSVPPAPMQATQPAPPTKRSATTSGYIPLSELPTLVPVMVGGHGLSVAFRNSRTDESSQLSSSEYDGSPTRRFTSQLAHRTRTPSDASINGHWPAPTTSRSPFSAGSSAFSPPFYFNGDQGHSSGSDTSCQPLNGPPYFEQPLSQHMNGMSDTSLCDLFYAAQDSMERTVLSGIGDNSFYISGDSFPDIVALNRLEGYWQWFHPLLPILHSPSFSFDSAPPLLRSAMIAVGAQYSSAWQDKTDAAALHAQCLKCLQK